MPFLLLFIIVPVLEVYAFAAMGDAIGAPQTVILCVVTAVIGGILVKQQGLGALFKAQMNISNGKLPLKEIFAGFCLIIAGFLLLTPGFVTDSIGFSLLIPQFREFLRQKLSKNGKFNVHMGKNTPYNDDIIDGEYETVTTDIPEIEKRKSK